MNEKETQNNRNIVQSDILQLITIYMRIKKLEKKNNMKNLICTPITKKNSLKEVYEKASNCC